MKTPAIQKLKRRLAADSTALGLWVTLESPSITEIAVALGLDWVVVDAEHGHLDWKEITEHVRAAVRSDTVVLVRLTELSAALVKRALDVGADGVIIPWIETADQLRNAVRFAKYPPEGVRGIGAERATGWGQAIVEHVREANDQVLVVPLIESVRGGENIDALLTVDGVELFFIGPSDYSSSAGYRGQWQGPGVAERLLAVKDKIRAAGKHVGVAATGEADLRERQEQGFRMLSIGSDCGLLLRSLRSTLATVGRDRQIAATLAPSSKPLPAAPLVRPPEALRPDRPEAVTELGDGLKMTIQPGVVFECLVGAHNDARNLTTGIVRFDPAVRLAYHTHPCTEAITLLSGAAVVDVEGRRYRLAPLDNVVIPAGVRHGVENTSDEHVALFHIAFPTDVPSREIVEAPAGQRAMPDDSTGPGTPGGEHVTRFAFAERVEAGPGAVVIDYFNHDITPGVEMSGGFGVFQPGARVPAHVPGFDESVCATDGEAVCVVEGRRYLLSNYATVLQPRGRVHYFANESAAPMALIWVSAGPDLQRIVVDEHNATLAGRPWD